jgi:hypothetical protein
MLKILKKATKTSSEVKDVTNSFLKQTLKLLKLFTNKLKKMLLRECLYSRQLAN